jgi:hypothetical protein
VPEYLNSDEQPQLGEALDKMVAALQILDELETPGDIGCHMDLAIARLEERLAPGRSSTSLGTQLAKLSEFRPGSDGQLRNLECPWEIGDA